MKPEIIYPIWNEWKDAHSEPHRHYHTASHIFYMFQKAYENGIRLTTNEIAAIWLYLQTLEGDEE